MFHSNIPNDASATRRRHAARQSTIRLSFIENSGEHLLTTKRKCLTLMKKNSICWVRYVLMLVLPYKGPVHDKYKPADDQLKPANQHQNIPNQHECKISEICEIFLKVTISLIQVKQLKTLLFPFQ
ncbi:MAG: hypothetical protein ACRC6N_03425 [Plesiomonas sp.]|uniref:hypothetical protein n=1 Tax=Plesiomonas sp. TaxID=2486279 RepID=UPI003F2C64FC